MNKFIKQVAASVFAVGIVASLPMYGVVQTLTVNKTNPKTVSAAWNGGDVVSSGSNGSITLSSSAAVQGIVKIRCNATTGYTLSFSTPNATSEGASILKKTGAGTTAETQLPYTATMDISQFSGTSTVVTNNLKLTGSGASVSATFGGGGNVLPLSAANANQVKLNLTLGTFDEADKEEGTYSDVITATVTVL